MGEQKRRKEKAAAKAKAEAAAGRTREPSMPRVAEHEVMEVDSCAAADVPVPSQSSPQGFVQDEDLPQASSSVPASFAEACAEAEAWDKACAEDMAWISTHGDASDGRADGEADPGVKALPGPGDADPEAGKRRQAFVKPLPSPPEITEKNQWDWQKDLEMEHNKKQKGLAASSTAMSGCTTRAPPTRDASLSRMSTNSGTSTPGQQQSKQSAAYRQQGQQLTGWNWYAEPAKRAKVATAAPGAPGAPSGDDPDDEDDDELPLVPHHPEGDDPSTRFRCFGGGRGQGLVECDMCRRKSNMFSAFIYVQGTPEASGRTAWEPAVIDDPLFQQALELTRQKEMEGAPEWTSSAPAQRMTTGPTGSAATAIGRTLGADARVKALPGRAEPPRVAFICFLCAEKAMPQLTPAGKSVKTEENKPS
eukprot:2789154-Amphidinium_carterae.1